jgi:hypothetical protein
VKLPNAERAVIDIRKLRDYCLNPNHPEGKHKAHVFLAKMGLKEGDAERLRKMIAEAILVADATEKQPTPFGRRFVVEFEATWYEKFVVTVMTVRTAWIIRNDEDFPRLTSCYIPRRR